MSKTYSKRSKKKLALIILIAVAIVAVLIALVAAIINLYVVKSTEDQIITTTQAVKINPDCIIVLGAMVHNDGSPSAILKARLDKGIELYNLGVSDKLLMSGDNGQKEYNEVVPMKEYAIEQGIPEDDIYLDYAGFSTYESMYRLRDIFEVDSAVVVTQTYHLHRALYIGNSLELDVSGVAAADKYSGQKMRDIREVFARVKSFGLVIVNADPTYLGATVSLDLPQGETNMVKKE